jgi:hypothetical protein
MNNKELFIKLSQKRKRDSSVLMDWEYRGIWETAIKKYAGTAHFIYELIQNADDSKAKNVEFILEQNGLWFKHDGNVKFTISNIDTAETDTKLGSLGHINSITAIGNSSKIDEQKIGKFGIGFKAVFAYSLNPHIYDDNFNFKLIDYIVPEEIEPLKDRINGTTVFYFPFNHPEKESSEAFSEIREKLQRLYFPTLFLKNIEVLRWKMGNKSGSYQSVAGKLTLSLDKGITIRNIYYESQNNSNISVENLLIFKKEFEHKEKGKYNVEIVLNIKDNELVPFENNVAFCFFPTKEILDFGFLINAPFLLTDSRDNIKANDQWNNLLIDSIAFVAANSLSAIKDLSLKYNIQLLNDNIFDIFPYDSADYSQINTQDNISFAPIYEKVFSKFQTQAILPGRGSSFLKSEKSFWAVDQDLTELFSDEQLSELMGNPESGFVFITKGQKQLNNANRPLERYIGSIICETIDAKKLIRRINSFFIESQTDQWLINFYTYLGSRKFLWDDKEKLAQKKPILLNQNRKAVIPFNDDLSAPNIFIPSEIKTSFDTVYFPFTEDDNSMEFFHGLGIGEPDLRAEVFNTIIPAFKGKIDYDDKVLITSYFDTLLSYYEVCPFSSREDYIDKLKEICFVATRNLADPETIFFCYPGSVYLQNEKLNDFFKHSPDKDFLDEDYYNSFINSEKKDTFYSLLNDLDCSSVPRIYIIDIEVSSETKQAFGIDDIEISQTYSTNQSISDTILDGLENVISNLTPYLSSLIWEYLVYYTKGKSIDSIDSIFLGTFDYVPKWNQYSKTVLIESTLTSIIKNERWLYDNTGTLNSISEIQFDNLNENYLLSNDEDSTLIEYLGLSTIEDELNLSEEQKNTYLMGKRLEAQGISNEELEEILSIIKIRKRTAFNQNEISAVHSEEEIDNPIDETIKQLKDNLTKKRLNKSISKEQQDNQEDSEKDSTVDQDEYVKPSIDIQKKLDKLREQTEAQIEDLTRIESLNEIISKSDIYSFIWFKSLLELEYLNSSESNSSGKEISIQFTKAEIETGTERTLILKHPNRYIPQSIEDIGDLQVRIYQGSESKTVTIEVVSVKEYTLRAKVKKTSDIENINFSLVNRLVIDIKNPVFIIEELRNSFNNLNFEDEFNLKENLSENIRFIFGPPGTGKTTFLAVNEIIPLMKQNENFKVLVLTPTNKAADVLTRRIIETMGTDESYYHWLIRFGISGDNALEESSIVVDKSFDISQKPKNTTITTIARFAYDYFQPNQSADRLHLKHLDWDYIIIDEASMVNLASIAYVLFKQQDSEFIIAGDPFQIQPISQIEQWKDMNIYSMVELNKFLNPTTTPHNFQIIPLNKQYRSVPTIGNLFSHFTYNGILEHNRDHSEQKKLSIDGLKFNDINIIKFPVTKYESIYRPNTLNKSNYQIYSALFAVEFVQSIASQIHKNHKEFYRIGLICPYKAQATLIEKLLAQQFENTSQVEVLIGTIHGFQGDECDIIISIFNPPFSISKHPGMFLNKQNILNVSISRARDYLFILMPDNQTDDIDNLYKIKSIEKLVYNLAPDNHSIYNSSEIERTLFGSESYIYDNSFATTHQSVNVYSKPEKKYEIRCEETAIDIQVKENSQR